ATGDIESLRAHHRQAIRVQLGRDQAATVKAITAALTGTTTTSRRTTPKKRRTINRR
ncbi:MAG: hypothetical protein JNK03_01565, partial [Nitrospira sp.]|nr:hypothetical protein [Nitrospira sp.]